MGSTSRTGSVSSGRMKSSEAGCIRISASVPRSVRTRRNGVIGMRSTSARAIGVELDERQRLRTGLLVERERKGRT